MLFRSQLRLGLKPGGKLVTTGLRVSDFLRQHRLIEQAGDTFVWVGNESPKISDPKFLELVSEISSGG